MIASVYNRYFQKSRTFLLPLLDMKQSNYTRMLSTFIEWEEVYTVEHKKLIILIDDFNPIYQTKDFEEFENKYLTNSKFYETTYPVEGGRIHVCTIQSIGKDFMYFLDGKYSAFSQLLKERIKNFYGIKSSEWKFLETYLYPNQFFNLYSQLLNVEETLLESVGELCDKYNPEKEQLTLKIMTPSLLAAG